MVVSEQEGKFGHAKYHFQDDAGLRLSSDHIWFRVGTPLHKLPEIADGMRVRHQAWRARTDEMTREAEVMAKITRITWETGLICNLILSKTEGLIWRCPDTINKLKDMIRGDEDRKTKIKILAGAIQADLAALPGDYLNDDDQSTVHSDGNSEGGEDDFIAVDSD
jgi:hypothetical protein